MTFLSNLDAMVISTDMKCILPSLQTPPRSFLPLFSNSDVFEEDNQKDNDNNDQVQYELLE